MAGLLGAMAWYPYASTRQYDAVEKFDRISAAGGNVTLAHAGTHTFWVEGTCMSCHDNNASEYRKVAKVAVTGPDGQRVKLHLPSTGEWTYNTARREGRALWSFDAPVAGRYHVTFDLDIDIAKGNWDNVPPEIIAFGEGDGLPVRIVRPMLVLALGGIVLGVGLALVTSFRRRRYFDRWL